MGAAIPSRTGEMTGQQIAELQHWYKFVKKEGAAKVRQTRMFTGDS